MKIHNIYIQTQRIAMVSDKAVMHGNGMVLGQDGIPCWLSPDRNSKARCHPGCMKPWMSRDMTRSATGSHQGSLRS